jgi:hypothetical protein
MSPLITPEYEPRDADERGLWGRIDRLEEDLNASDLIVRDPALNEYLRGVARRVVGDVAGDIRIIIIRNAQFNAAMLPNGLLLVNSGLLLRMRSEAELAGVLGHEIGHYVRLHQLRQWRDIKRRSGVSAFLSVGLAIGGAAFGVGTYDLISAINNAMYFGMFSYSRNLETEADAMGLRLIAQANYQPMAMSDIWSSMVAEEAASAQVRGRHRNRGYSMFATHPAPEERMRDLRLSAEELAGSASAEDGRERYLAVLRPHLSDFVRDQVMLNDPGASLYVIRRLEDGQGSGLLKYYEGETYRLRAHDGDSALAETAYAEAIALPDAPPEAWRAHGYGLIRRGQAAEGRAALSTYLERRPDAADAAMVRYALAN